MFKNIVLMSLLTLSACSATEPLIRTEILEVPVPVLAPLEQKLTEPCEIPMYDSSKEITYGDVVAHDVALMGTVKECNAKLAEIRRLYEQE